MSSRPHIREFLDATETIEQRSTRHAFEALVSRKLASMESVKSTYQFGKMLKRKPRPAGAFPPMPEPKP